jgi:hypothetical protein
LFLAILIVAPSFSAAGQVPLALGAGAEWAGGSSSSVNRALMAAALRPVYSVRLASDWPELVGKDGRCRNGGEEVITGELELTSGGNYLGTLTREATIRFCGAHGPATEACSLTLRSTGPVAARGEVEPFRGGWTNPLLTLHWAAPAGAVAEVDGDCQPAFAESLRRLYLGVTHMIEFHLPVTGEGRHREHLEEGWIVEVQ